MPATAAGGPGRSSSLPTPAAQAGPYSPRHGFWRVEDRSKLQLLVALSRSTHPSPGPSDPCSALILSQEQVCPSGEALTYLWAEGLGERDSGGRSPGGRVLLPLSLTPPPANWDHLCPLAGVQKGVGPPVLLSERSVAVRTERQREAPQLLARLLLWLLLAREGEQETASGKPYFSSDDFESPGSAWVDERAPDTQYHPDRPPWSKSPPSP